MDVVVVCLSAPAWGNKEIMEPSPGQFNLLQGPMQSSLCSRCDWGTAQMEWGNAKEQNLESECRWIGPSIQTPCCWPSLSPYRHPGALSSLGTLQGAVRNLPMVFLPSSVFFWKHELRVRNKYKWLAWGRVGSKLKRRSSLLNPVWLSCYLFHKENGSFQVVVILGQVVEDVMVTISKTGPLRKCWLLIFTQARCKSPWWQTKEVGLLEWKGYWAFCRQQSPGRASYLSLYLMEQDFCHFQVAYLAFFPQKLAVWKYIIWHVHCFLKMCLCRNVHSFRPITLCGQGGNQDPTSESLFWGMFFFSLSYYLAK